ncbi:MAG: GHKL domain-containing protein [Bacilli bacterium]|jgi:two-component system sensor histidine kinase AgrC
MSVVNYIISPILIVCCWLYAGTKIFDKKINFKSIKIILSIVLGALIFTVIYLSFDNFVRIFMNYILIGSLYKLVFNESINKSLAASFITISYYFISEIIVTALVALILNAFDAQLDQNLVGSLLMNFSISFIYIILISSKKSDKVIKSIVHFFDRMKSQEMIICIVFAIGVFGKKNVTFLGVGIDYIMNLTLLCLFGLITYYLYKEKENHKSLSGKYDQLLNYVKRYEEEITAQSMSIHEFKNQIISIKGFIPKRNKQLNAYIDSIIIDLKNQESIVLKDMENLPKGGLKGLIYYKLGNLKDKGIKVITKIDPRLKKNFILENDYQLYNDVLKIIGVYLDNAIEAVSLADNKEILIEMYYDKKSCHCILTNTYDGEIEVNKIDNIGYSTKGKNRGYGLHLVNRIIDKYDNLSQTREVTEKTYSIHLIIDK